ncbi:MAG: hypothetical protein ABSF63_10330 [Candidatus Bathyarchaeia archaeon]
MNTSLFNTYGWILGGLAATYNGTVIAPLIGVSGYNPNPATPKVLQCCIMRRSIDCRLLL